MTKRKVMVAGAVLSGFGIVSDELHQAASAEPTVLPSDSAPASAYIRPKEIPFRVVSPKSSLAVPAARPEVRPTIIEYSVRKGDTLSQIAKRFKVTVRDLVEINQIRDPDRISVNQKLRIPVEKSAQTHPAPPLSQPERSHGTAGSRTEQADGTFDTQAKRTDGTIESHPGRADGNSAKAEILARFPQHVQGGSAKKKTVQIAAVSFKPSSKPSSDPLSLSFSWPVRDYRITSRFGMRWGDHHNGIDLVSRSQNLDIRAAKTGTVRFSGKSGNGYGNLVILSHGNGVETYYAHLSKVLVKEGDVVRAGEVIGRMGDTGHSTGIHLHFEIRKRDKPVNPLRLLDKEMNRI